MHIVCFEKDLFRNVDREWEKSVGTTELLYSTKKRYHVLDILKSLFVGRNKLFSMSKTWHRFFVQ